MVSSDIKDFRKFRTAMGGSAQDNQLLTLIIIRSEKWVFMEVAIIILVL